MIAVVIASLGRPDVVGRAVRELEKQTRLPDYLVLSVCEERDLPSDLLDFGQKPKFPTRPLYGKRGLTAQRNRAITFLQAETTIMALPSGVVVFFDDDFIMSGDWLEVLEREMMANPGVVGYTGLVLADGAALEGYNADAALAILSGGKPVLAATDWRMRSGETESLYGCNMAIRSWALQDVQFDEALIMYGWLEDFDFSVRLSRKGALQRSPFLAGVHLGWKAGRGSGAAMGYAQVANPVYLFRKRTMSLRQATKYACKNFAANVIRSVQPERFLDRRGRLYGNILAFRDLLLDRIEPSRIAEINSHRSAPARSS